MKKNTKKLTVASMLCALCVVLMLIGSIIEVMDLSVSALASFIVIFAVIEMGGAYPYLIWTAGSILALLLLPNKLPAIYFAMFFGWYPIVKNYFERVAVWLSWILKTAAFVISFGGMLYVSSFFVGADEIMSDITIPLMLVGVLVFVIFDIALTRIIRAYMNIWRKKLKIKF